MPEPVLIKEAQIAPKLITVGERLRPVTDAGVNALITSIHSKGQILNPIHLRQIKKRGNKPAELRLIAGAYRMAAAQKLGIEVPAKIWVCNANQAAMMEIDDQVAGRGLDPLDNALFLGRRKAIYDKLHPQMKRGGFRGNQYTGNMVKEIISFTTATAEQCGLSERQIRNYVRIGETLTPSEIHALRKAPKPVGMVELLALAKIGSAKKRAKVCKLLGAGEASTVAKALSAANGVSKPVQSAFDKALNRQLDAWSRAPMAAKRAFVELRRDELEALLASLDGKAA